MVKRIWGLISSVGIYPGLHELDKKNIVFINRISVVLGFFVLSSIIINVILGSDTFIPALTITFFFLLLTYPLHYKRKYRLARINIILTIQALITFMLFNGGKGSGLEFYYLSLAALAVLMFREKNTILFFQGLSVLLLIVQFLFAKPPVVPESAEIIIQVFFVVNSIYSALAIILGIMFYKKISMKYKNELLAKNAILEKAQEKLKKSESFLKEAQKMAGLGSWEWDIETNEMVWSEEIYHLYGYEMGLVKVNFAFFLNQVHPEDLDYFTETFRTSGETGSTFSLEYRVKQLSNKTRYCYTKGRCILSENGKVQKVLGSTLDLTDIRTTREALRQKDEFISIASHELKTPLTSIKAYNQLLAKMLEESNIEVSREYVKKNETNINKLNLLVSDLLDISKMHEGTIQFSMKEFSFSELVKHCIENIQAGTKKHKIILECGTEIKITGDKTRLEQVITNYLSNAIKYSPDSKDVIVEIKSMKNEVIFSVTDSGIGIAKEKLEKVFERFYRVEKTSARFSGLGIGLYISAEILRRHNGKYWVESQEGKGSTFYFSLPR